ncbi:hypothetical protein ACFXNW_28970 [Nocardia sp. NPDC059180]|uniref:hypothetical protein n=1 Tax=Nocardia sp. NPDC059180 TaxID=3346761 RepID=UPI0036938C63
MYVTDGTWAFDHCGWTYEAEVLDAHKAAEPDAGYRQQRIDMDLDEFCARHWHRTRAEFAYDPWRRAHNYIARHAEPGALR